MIFTDNYDMSLFEFSINNEQENYMIFDKLVTENEMLCSIYENEQLVIETNREIFTSLGYTSINEASIKGIAAKIKKGILFVLGKLKDLITRFINFILGKSKKSNNNDEKQLLAIPDDPKDVEKMAEGMEEDIEKNIKVANDVSEILKKIDLKQKMDKVEIIKSEIEEIWNAEKYFVIPDINFEDYYIASEIQYTVNKLNNNKLLDDIKNAIQEGLKILKDPQLTMLFSDKDLKGSIVYSKEVRSKFPDYMKVVDGIEKEKEAWEYASAGKWRSSYEKELFTGVFSQFNEKNMLDETHKKIYDIENNKVNFQKYKRVISDSLYTESADKVLQKSLESFKKVLPEINRLQNEVNSLKEPSNTENVYMPAYNAIYNNTVKNITMYYNAYSWTIKYLMDVDRLYSYIRKNIFTLMMDERKLNSLSEQLRNIARELLKSGQIPKDSQYYKYLNDIGWEMGSARKYTKAKYNYDGMRE